LNVERVDVAIVGGGAGGLGAALVLGRARRSVVVIDEGRPRNARVAHSYGFLGHDGIAGAKLLARGREEVHAYGVALASGRVDSIDVLADDRFIVHAGERAWDARAIVLATGLRDVLPAIPGLEEIWGTDAAECPYCHGWEVRDRAIGVVGGGTDKLPRVAPLLTVWSRDVMLISSEAATFDGPTRARLEAAGVRVVPQDVARFATRRGKLRAVVLADGSEIAREAIFVAMPTVAASELAGTLCDVDANGFAIVDPEGRTSRTGVWAVGNAADRIAKLVHSAAAGSRAAASINTHLFERDLAAAMASVR
jgi:thioredoxin reductase (NADPH)